MENQSHSIGNISGKLLVLIACTFLFLGCLEERLEVAQPKTGPVNLQMHDFNKRIGGVPQDGDAPDMFYFKQNEDGAYKVILSSNLSDNAFETNWDSQLVLISLDQKGVIQEIITKDFPNDFGTPWNFWTVYDVTSDNYVGRSEPYAIGTNRISYLRYNRVIEFNFPDSWNSFKYFEDFESAYPLGLFKTANGDNLIISLKHNQIGNYTENFISYSKFNHTGDKVFEFSLDYPVYTIYNTFGLYSFFLTSKSGDYYFFYLHSQYWDALPHMVFNNTASFLSAESKLTCCGIYTDFHFEIRFGPGKIQKAHRFRFSYEDFVDVPFEVWDIANNRQLTVAFGDYDGNGKINLGVTPEPFRFFDIEYDTVPNSYISTTSCYECLFSIGDVYPIWTVSDPASLPDASITIEPPPLNTGRGKLVKVNDSGISVVNNDLLKSPGGGGSILKIVPYSGGFVIGTTAELFLLDADFNQYAVYNMNDIGMDGSSKLESNGSAVFYTSILQQPGQIKVAIRISKIENGARIDKFLNEFNQFTIETYQITPTNNGGLAILAWVRPTNDTRDLLFLEFDKDLNLLRK